MKKIPVICLSFLFLFQGGFAYGSNYEAYKVFLKGVMSSKAGQFDAARKDYEKVISLDPEALAVYKDLTYLYWQAGNTQKANEAAEKINEMDGNNPQTTIFLATYYLVANKPDTAKKFWEKTLELEPDNETATVYLAAYYYSDNKLQESVEYWNKFLKQQPDSSAGYFQLAMVQEKLNMFEEALESYDKVIELRPEAKEAYLSKARIYERTGRFDEAIAEYEEYMEVFPDNLFVLMYLGKSYFEINELKKARDAFSKAKKGLGGDVTASYWLGVIYEKLGQLDKAAAEFEYLSTKEPSVAIYARLGYYYSLLKDYSKAEKRILKALDREPLNFELWYLLALNYMDWKKYDKAIESFKRVVEVNPGFVDAYFFMGSAYDKNGDYDNAELAFLKTIEIAPEHTRALNYLGYTYADRNINLDRAEELLVKTVSLEPNNGAYLDSLGWLYYRLGRYEDAQKYIASAARITRDPLIYEHLGDVSVELGQVEDAWLSYAMSYDIKKDKGVRKKIDLVEEGLAPEKINRLMLIRSAHNYNKINSFKTGYTMKAKAGLYSVKAFVPFTYIKNEGMNIEVPPRFVMGGAHIYLADGNLYSNPKAVMEALPAEFAEILNSASKILSIRFFGKFSEAETERKKKETVYTSPEGYVLTLNNDDALIKTIKSPDLEITIKKYSEMFNAQIPSRLDIKSDKLKFKVSIEGGKISVIISREETERDSQREPNVIIKDE